MDAFARAHWNDTYSGKRGQLSIEGDKLVCMVDGERIEGDVTAPLMFVAGAWGLIFAHENDGGYGHRINGRINRIWPNGAQQSLTDHKMTGEVLAWSKLWPGKLFSSELYRGVDTPGHKGHPRSMENAPGRTSLAGIMRRVVKGADDPDPLERLKVAEFVLYNITEWSQTAEDLMMGILGPPLMRLAGDAEPAVREVALLALEHCAFRCWVERAYGLYEDICRKLADAGLSAHLQYARLAESAYASGDIAGGDRLWAIGSDGINPLRSVKLSQAYDHIGDWTDLQTRILRQAGGANIGYMLGNDPNPARHAKKAKKGIVPAAPDKGAHYRGIARPLLERAAQGAEARLAIDIPAIKAGRNVPIGGGEIDPHRRLFLSDIFTLQSRIAEAEGDNDAQLCLIFKAMTVEWRLAGEPSVFHSQWDDYAGEVIAEHKLAELLPLGPPAYFADIVKLKQAEGELAGSAEGREALFWRRVLLSVSEEFLSKSDHEGEYLPLEELNAGFVVERDGGEVTISHPKLPDVVRGSVSKLLLTGLRAWNALIRATTGHGVDFYAQSYTIFALRADDLPVLAAIAGEQLDAGREPQAIQIYRMISGTDPLITPWPYNNPVTPLPLADVPAAIRDEVARRSDLEANGGFAKTKPRGKRIEELAQALDDGDPVNARLVAHYMREASSFNDSEARRALKAGVPLLMRLWANADAGVREATILATENFLNYAAQAADMDGLGALMDLIEDAEVMDLTHLRERYRRYSAT